MTGLELGAGILRGLPGLLGSTAVLGTRPVLRKTQPRHRGINSLTGERRRDSFTKKYNGEAAMLHPRVVPGRVPGSWKVAQVP